MVYNKTFFFSYFRYLASGNTFTDLSYAYRLGIATISNIVKETCNNIWAAFRREYIPKPTKEKWLIIAREFEQRAHFPHCLGAVDGKHVRVQKFAKSGSMYLNYKHYFSIVLLAIVDADYRFIFVDIGAYGKDCDSSILQETPFWKSLQENTLEIPKPAPLTENGSAPLPYVFLGDEAFPLTTHLLRPYGRRNDLDINKKIFNYRHCRARRYVECAFGILSNKWRILHRPINTSKQLAIDIVKACVILHNLVRARDGYRSDDFYVAKGFQNLPRVPAHRGGRHANDIREAFSSYFTSPTGSLPWQTTKNIIYT